MASRRVAQPRHLPDHLLAEGVSWVTTEALASRLGVEPARVPDSLERARAAGRILSITKGAWLVVPPEYLRWGAPPPTHDVDAWMRYLGHPYYVGLLSAAAHLGRDVHLEAMAQFVSGRRTVPLDPRGPAHGPADPRWRVLMNAPLEIDA
jgi:hypothetical protein